MVDPNKAFDAENGFFIDEGTGIWVGGGDSVPTVNAPEGSMYYRTSPPELYRQEGSGVTNTWVLFSTGGAGRIIDLSFNDSSGPSVKTTSTSYTVLGSFIFPGTSQAELDTAKATVTGSSSPVVSFRIYDFTNALTIAEITGQATTDAKQIFDLGTVSNLPSNPAIFEAQLKKDSGGGSAELHALSMYKDLS